MKNYHTATQEDYNALMIELENKGCMWYEEKPTAKNYWPKNEEKTYVMEENGYLTYGRMEPSYRELYSKEPFVDYKAKGENMLNTECKQCHKKWHHDNAKYCSMCGKKLVSEPDFKSGDIVASQVFSDGSFSFVQLNEDLTNRFTSVDGFWYIKRDCEVRDESLVVFIEDTRHATPEEIEEYETALVFRKHGRNLFEVKKGDLIRTQSGEFTFICNPENYTKEEFLDYGWEFLKTSEEVNEWIGAGDE